MEKLKILPLTIYKFVLPDEIYSEIKKLLKNIDFEEEEHRINEVYYGRSTTGVDSLHNKKEWQSVVNYVNDKLQEVAKEVRYTDFADSIKTCLMWANKSNFDEWHHRHYHPWSCLSGIIYIQGKSGNTWFSRSTEYRIDSGRGMIRSKNMDEKEYDRFQTIYTHKCEDKTMVIFPSTLEHSVDENKSSTPRITLSFNSFFSGHVGDKNSLSGLDIQIK